MKEHQKLSNIFKALSNTHRLDLFLRIKRQHELDLDSEEKNGCLLSAICQNLKLGAPTISHHLKELVNSELVNVEKNGKFIVCKLNPKILREVQKVFRGRL